MLPNQVRQNAFNLCRSRRERDHWLVFIAKANSALYSKAFTFIPFAGLMISAYAKAGQVLDDDSYTDRALQTVQFLRAHMFRSASGVLLRSCYTSADGDTVTQM